MAEDTGSAPAGRPPAADLLRQAGRWLGWFVRLLLGLAWTTAYLLLRFVEASKRVLACQVFLAAVCVTIIWVLLSLRDLPLWAVLGLLIGVIWAVSSEAAWQELRARMEFIAEAHPDTRLLHADGELRRLCRPSPDSWRWYARLTLLALVMILAVTGWHEMSLNLRAMLVSFLAAISAVIFVAIGWAFWQLERLLQVQFYLKGWRFADPAHLELLLLTRWPRLERILGWRAAITSRLAGLKPGMRWWLQPWGTCAE